MLKLQYRDSARSVWLVGPSMTLGTASTNDIVINDDGVAPVHGKLNISENSMEYETCDGNEAFLNEVAITGNKALSLGDVIRVGASEFVIIDPKDAAGNRSFSSQPANTEETVFRMPAAESEQASGWMLQGMHSSLKNKRYPVDGTVILGRSQDCGLSFSYDRLSRKHAEFKVIDNVLMIKDLGSSNGTFHNGERVTQAKLHPGDTVSFDKLEFTVIGPSNSANDDASLSSDGDNLNQTVVRAAITPEMIRQAQAAEKSAPSSAGMAADAPMIQSQTKGSGPGGIMIIAAVLIVAGLVGAYFLLPA